MTDVSCRVILDNLDFLERKSLPPEPLLAAWRQTLGPRHAHETSADFIQDADNRITWNAFARFLELWSEAVGGPSGEREFLDVSFNSAARWTSAIRPVMSLAMSPRQFYLLTARWAGAHNFSNVKSAVTPQADGRLLFQLHLRPGDTPCAPYFRMCAYALAHHPSFVGYPDALVEEEYDGSYGRYLVTLPPSLSLWSRFKRRLNVFFAAHRLLDELVQRDEAARQNYGKLLAAHHELEDKVRQRTLDLENANRELQERVAALREVEIIAHLGSWSWDLLTGRVTWSEECYRIFDVRPNGSVLSFADVARRVHPEDRVRLHAAIERIKETGEAFTLEHRILHQDGSCRSVETRAAAFRDESGRSVRLIGTVHDVTLAKEYERSLIKAKEVADNANRTKTTFLASMSHEIRTPMTSVLGFADLLAKGDMPPGKRQTYIEKILRNGRHLLALIDDILDLSKIEAGHFVVQSARFSPTMELMQALDLLREQADRKGLSLTLTTEAPFPEWMASDQVRFQQILLNLVGNAIKFTDQGEVAVTARSTDGMLEIQVRDTGVGMAPEHQEALFQPFSQANVLSARPRGGSGLGLALARNLARALGGDAFLAASERGKGSTFVVRVKLDLEPSGASRMLPLGNGLTLQLDGDGSLPGFPKGVRVLVVEDNLDIQEIVRRILEGIGGRVTTASNGEECLMRIAQETFDVVVMDMQMPVLDGFQATARLRQSGFRQPIVAITAFAMSGEREKCLAAGCSDFLAKPVDALSLIRTVARWANEAKGPSTGPSR